MTAIIKPLLGQGLSPYQIPAIHPELGISEKTLYTYIETGVFHEIAGISAMDLRRQVSRRLPKKKAKTYKKRQEVVKIELSSPAKMTDEVIPSFQKTESCRISDNFMELSIAGAMLRIPNGTDPVLLRQTLHMLRELSC